jgi:hypothetical protein
MLPKPLQAVVGRLEHGAMNSASDLGERFGIDLLTYNPLRMRQYHRYATQNAKGVITSLHRCFPEAQRYADIGSGSGAYVAEARRRGLQAIGCERSRTGRALTRRQSADAVRFDLTDDPPAALPWSPDLAYSFEVAEHLPEPLGARLVAFLCGLAPVVVFSSAHPGQGGTGHINEQPQEYWRAQFASHGMSYDAETAQRLRASFDENGVVAPWFTANVQVFHR